jgi:hypothetical protein
VGGGLRGVLTIFKLRFIGVMVNVTASGFRPSIDRIGLTWAVMAWGGERA